MSGDFEHVPILSSIYIGKRIAVKMPMTATAAILTLASLCSVTHIETILCVSRLPRNSRRVKLPSLLPAFSCSKLCQCKNGFINLFFLSKRFIYTGLGCFVNASDSDIGCSIEMWAFLSDKMIINSFNHI